MALRWRVMQPNDVSPCAEIVAAHPVIGTRYGRLIRDLRPAWLRLAGAEAATMAVFEDVNEGAIRIWGTGVAVFVNEGFMRELKTRPLFWFGPELAKRITAGNSPVLSNKEVREANAGQGLNLLVWEGLLCPEFATRAEAYRLMVSAFLELHRGFLLKEMITAQSESVQRLQWAVDAGGLFWDTINSRYSRSLNTAREEFIREPHIVGLTREAEDGRPGSWVGTLFDYQPPRFGFRPSEQRLLLCTLTGVTGTDQESSAELGVSLSTVKKTWLSIYERVAECEGKLIPEYDNADGGATERGKEKRRSLLAYLRQHPEELRPVSRRLLETRPR